ncbi:hypothetical protein NC651_015688 [Populus alba x Populus x berolinensis]|nr:hypothetical protein NC651_015688 [Populus alba x Populus x berolinensis]
MPKKKKGKQSGEDKSQHTLRHESPTRGDR